MGAALARTLAVSAWLRRDIEPLLKASDPEVEWYPFTAQVEGDEPYRGHDGLRRWFANLGAAFDEFEATVDEAREKGDVVVGLGRLRSRFKSGLTLDAEIRCPGLLRR